MKTVVKDLDLNNSLNENTLIRVKNLVVMQATGRRVIVLAEKGALEILGPGEAQKDLVAFEDLVI